MLTATQLAWANRKSERRLLCIVFPEHGELEPVYLSTEPFTSDGDLAVSFNPIIKGEFTLRRAVGGLLLGGGANETGVGRITVIDRDNKLASWSLMDWTDRPATIYWGSPLWSDLDDHVVVTTVYVESVEPGDGEREIIVRPAFEASRYLLPDARYTTALGGESTGEPIQIAWGQIKDAPVQLINDSTLKYGVSLYPESGFFDWFDSLSVKDNGVLLTPTTDWTQSDIGTTPNRFVQIDLDNVVGTITFDGVTGFSDVSASTVLADIMDTTVNTFDISVQLTTDLGGSDIDIGYFVRDPTSVAEIFDEAANSIGSAWYLTGGIASTETPRIAFTQITIPGESVFTFNQDNIQGGITSTKASDAVESIVIGVRNSWAESGDDAIDPAIAPKIKRDLQKTHNFQVASIDAEKVDNQEPPRDLEPIETLLTDPAQAAIEGARWQEILSVERRIHTFRALTGAGQIQPLDSVQIQHTDLSDYSELTDNNGAVITDNKYQPVLMGVRARVKVLEESFPSGSVQVDGWA